MGAVPVPTVTLAVAVQPPLPVAVTVYNPVLLTVIDAVLPPVDQTYVFAPVAVNKTEPPPQTAGLLGLIEILGAVPVPTLTAAEAVQPPFPVTVTE